MGREIRRVPKDWQHPKDESGHYLALYDETHAEALTNYNNEHIDWENNRQGIRSRAERVGFADFDEWHGSPPEAESCRPKFDAEPTHYQIYETVTEGTPTSPVFASLDKMVIWLIGEGYSEHAAKMFARDGWAPSMMFSPDKGVSGIGIHSLDWVNEESDQ